MEKCRHKRKSGSSMSKRHCYKVPKTLMSPKLQLADGTVAPVNSKSYYDFV